MRAVKVIPGANEVPVIVGDMSKPGAATIAAELRDNVHTVFGRTEAG